MEYLLFGIGFVALWLVIWLAIAISRARWRRQLKAQYAHANTSRAADSEAYEKLLHAAAVARDVQARAIFNRMAVQDARDVGRAVRHTYAPYEDDGA